MTRSLRTSPRLGSTLSAPKNRGRAPRAAPLASSSSSRCAAAGTAHEPMHNTMGNAAHAVLLIFTMFPSLEVLVALHAATPVHARAAWATTCLLPRRAAGAGGLLGP